jgi:hypothetical protein
MRWPRHRLHAGRSHLALVVLVATLGCGDDEQASNPGAMAVAGTNAPGAGNAAPATGGTNGQTAGAGPTAGSGGIGASGASGDAAAGTSAAGAGGGAGADAQPTGGGTASNGDGSTNAMAAPDLFTVDYRLASDVDPQAPGTVVIVEWSVALDAIATAKIEFGLDGAFDVSAPVDLDEADFRTLLLGLKPARSYTFRIVASDGSASYVSDTYTVETGPPTTAVAVGEMDILDEAAHMPGFIIGSYHNASGVVWIMDPDGEIVWWVDAGVGGVARARMSADSKNMWIVSADLDGGPMIRVSMDTLDHEVYSYIATHDVTPVEGELVAYIDKAAVGILAGGCGLLKEVTPTGEPKTIFDPAAAVPAGGFCHANALRYSKTEDVYTLSDYGHDVYVVARSGELQWRLSEIVPGGQATWAAPQHGHHLVDDGMVIFANNAGPNMASSIIKYDLQGREVFRYDSAEGLDTPILGDVQVLPGGNMLISYCTAGRVQEIDASGKLVMQFQSSPASNQMGYVLWRDSLYGVASDLLQ